MKNLLRLEEFAQFLLCLFLLIANDVQWWWYLLLVLAPDIGMLGYLINSRVGAFTYNLLHHKGIALLVVGAGMIESLQLLLGALTSSLEFELHPAFLIGIILYGHASMDRIFGYGLKFGDNFHHTHLGWIGKAASRQRQVGE